MSFANEHEELYLNGEGRARNSDGFCLFTLDCTQVITKKQISKCTHISLEVKMIEKLADINWK